MSSGNRVAQGFVVGVLVTGLLALAAVTIILLLYGTCDGDGGSPYSARDSVAGGFCDSPAAGVWAVAALVAPAITALVLGIGAIRLRAWKRVAVAVAIGIAVLIVLCGVVVALPNNCSSADQRAYDAWLKTDQHKRPPADCDTY
ncbi:MAG: hypothetical protein QOF76_725 [Solirubrobacteraceae bacterium]|jgi:hypothetical protein|nr:hypothetical protein [Solirubrobacteraceae bacterium]